MFLSKKNNILIFSIFFILIGVFLRIYQLNFESYWLDEMISYWVADPNISLSDTLTRRNQIEQTPVLFDLFLKEYMKFLVMNLNLVDMFLHFLEFYQFHY